MLNGLLTLMILLSGIVSICSEAGVKVQYTDANKINRVFECEIPADPTGYRFISARSGPVEEDIPSFIGFNYSYANGRGGMFKSFRHFQNDQTGGTFTFTYRFVDDDKTESIVCHWKKS